MAVAERLAMVLAVLIVFAGVAWFVQTKKPAGGEVPNFIAEGNLVIDTPGLTPGVWYLVYEEPGFPGLSVQLRFDELWQCRSADVVQACTGFRQGDRVRITGFSGTDEIRVATLDFVRPEERSIPVKLYYYDPKKDVDETGNILCSAKGLVPVDRVLPFTTTPLTEAIKLLLRGEISDEEKAAGVTSEFPLLGVRLENVSIENGVATLVFSDMENKTGGGSCRVAILWAQIENTAKQFPTVKEVRFLPEELFQP